jgi:colanic acid biosynthesis glycosyl transferase WcaI
MARVLLLTLVFPPDSVSTAQIMGDLATDLLGLGHDVTVVTTTPHYNRDPELEARQPLRPWWGRVVQRSSFAGATVYHTAMPAKTASIPRRLLAWLQFHILSLAVGVCALRRVDVIVAPSPPLTMGVAAWLLGLRHRAPFVYNVQEIYPDIAIRMGAVRNRRLIALLHRLERFVYARAAVITLIADGMARRLLEKGVPRERIEVIPNFVDVDAFQAVAAPNAFTREFGLDGAFLVTYAGNLGPLQGLDLLLDAAQQLRDEPAVVFAIVGGGTLRDPIARRIRQDRLENVRLIPFQPVSRVPEIYGASDLNVVALASSTGSDAVPSKVYRIMACARPVLAVTDADSDLAALVREAGSGIIARPAARDVAEAIRRAHADRSSLAALGAAGRRHVERHYARPLVTARYDALLTRLAQASGR